MGNIEFDVYEWILWVVELGVGEFLVNLMDCDGIENGFDIVFYCDLIIILIILVVVLGGVGLMVDFEEVFVNFGVIGVMVVLVFYFD